MVFKREKTRKEERIHDTSRIASFFEITGLNSATLFST
jgi:hypothetical protein